MSINEKLKKVKPATEPLRPELISWDEPLEAVPVATGFSLNSLKSKYLAHLLAVIGVLSGGSFFFLGRMSALQRMFKTHFLLVIKTQVRMNLS